MATIIPNPTLRRIEAGIHTSIFIYKIENNKFTLAQEQLGGLSFTNDVSQESTPFYAGDQVHLMLTANKTITNTITLAQIDSEFRQLLGDNLNADSSYDDGGNAKPFALAYLQRTDYSDGTFNYKLKTFYNMVGTYPGSADETRSDSVTPNEYEIVATGSASTFVTSPTNGELVSRAEWYIPRGINYNTIANLLRTTLPVPGSELPITDDTPPIISAPIVNPVNYDVDEVKTYSDLLSDSGSTAIDNVDGDVSSDIVYTNSGTDYSGSDTLDTSTNASLTITLNVSDKAGNDAEQSEIDVEINAPA